MSTKSKKILQGVLIGIVLQILIIFAWYKIEITPEINQINSLVSFNENHIKELKEKDPEKFLFNDNYTDEQFNKDYKLFSDIYKVTYNKEKEDNWGKDYPKVLWGGVLNKYYSIMYLNKVYPEFSYDKLMDYQLLNTLKAISVKDENKRDALLLENSKFVKEKFRYTELIMLESTNSILFMDKYYYDEMVKLFNDKYGDDSIIKALMVKSTNIIPVLENVKKPSNNLDKQNKEDSDRDAITRKERDKINLKIGEAFLNNDKDKMKLYVKQMREYMNFLNGFNLPYYQELGRTSSYDYKKRVIALQVVLFKNGSDKDTEKLLHTVALSRYPY